MVCKRDGTMRFCVDYCKTNELIKKDKFPLPKINTCLDILNSCWYVSSCNLRWAYWQMEIDERGRNKTAFVMRKKAMTLQIAQLQTLQCSKPVCLYHRLGLVGFHV